MPVKKRTRTWPTASDQRLVQRLAEEWRNPQNAADLPVIIEEQSGPDQPLHLYVVWDEWGSLDQVERSEIIMEAFERVQGLDASLNVTVAMGLTPVEADRMRISYR